jgi:hypothetical protein
VSLLLTRMAARGFDPRFSPRFVVDVARGGLVDMVRGVQPIYARAGSAWGFVGGKLRAFAANVPRIVDSPVGGVAFLQENTITNKATNHNANPTDLTNVTFTNAANGLATCTVVDDSAALAAAGLSEVCSTGKVYRLDNTLGANAAFVLFSGGAGNTNTHVVSAFIRGGTGDVRPSSAAGLAFAASAGYVRRDSGPVVPGGAGTTSRISVNAGQDVYFILNQYEENTIATSPIVIAGATATRNLDNLSYPFASSGDITLFADCVFAANADTVNAESVLTVHDGTNNERVALSRLSGGSMNGLVVDGGTAQASLNVGLVLGGQRCGAAVRAKQDDCKTCANGALSAGDIAATMPTTTTLHVGRTAPTASSVPRQLYMRGFRVYPVGLTDAQLQAVAP